MDKEKKSGITFIGSGKIVHSFLPALLKNNYYIHQIISRNKDTAAQLAKAYEIKLVSCSISDLVANRLVFIAVPDNQIKSVSSKISKLSIPFEEISFVHFSGAKDSSELKLLEEKGSSTASFHIMQTFPGYEESNIAGSYAALETNSPDLKSFLFELASDLKLLPFEIEASEKERYHLAGVIAVNFLSANLTSSITIARGLKSVDNISEVLLPIIRQKIDNILIKGPVESLSGPIERGDIETVKKHLKALKNEKPILLNYLAASLVLTDTALEKGSINAAQGRRLKQLLENGIKEVLNSENKV